MMNRCTALNGDLDILIEYELREYKDCLYYKKIVINELTTYLNFKILN